MVEKGCSCGFLANQEAVDREMSRYVGTWNASAAATNVQ